MQQLFQLLNFIAPMSPELQAYLTTILQRREFKKGEFIVKEGYSFPYIYFIEAGLVRIFHINTEEVTTWLLVEKDIFISPRSFFRGLVSDSFIEAVEDCICWGITREQLVETCRLFPEFHIHREWLTEEYYLRDHDRYKEMQLQLAVDRYAALVEKRPDLVNRVTIELLASYLGVGVSTFKKARSEYAKRNKK